MDVQSVLIQKIRATINEKDQWIPTFMVTTEGENYLFGKLFDDAAVVTRNLASEAVTADKIDKNAFYVKDSKLYILPLTATNTNTV